MLTINTIAPLFTLPDQTGTMRDLASFRGSYVLIYFYPKDDTPGCTKEACMIAEVYDDFRALGVTVIGVSADSPESHKRFAEKYHLPFILLSDSDKTVIKAYEANRFISIKRISYLIDPEGVIVKVYDSVDPATHALQLLTDIRAMKTI